MPCPLFWHLSVVKYKYSAVVVQGRNVLFNDTLNILLQAYMASDIC